MKMTTKSICSGLLACSLAFLFQNCSQQNTSQATAENKEPLASGSEFYALEDFASVEKFDTHVHFNKADTTFLAQARKDNFRLLTINVNPAYYPAIETQQEIALQLIQAYPRRISYATTISLAGFNEPGWQKKTLAYLQDSFNKGAIAVKVWKNIGMELKDKNGKFVMIDDPRFDPILDLIEKNNATLIAHIGEPKNCWLPIEQMTVSGDKNYFKSHPEYHMYLHPEYPSYEQIIAARDRMLQKHPNLRVVGAHLGSLEWNVDELAKRLDLYPNLAVDMAARMSHFQYQALTKRDQVRDFLIKYQDRLIYATDLEVNDKRTAEERNKGADEAWRADWKFLTSAEKMTVSRVNGEFQGLQLPRTTVDKIYRENAEKWFPGVNKSL